MSNESTIKNYMAQYPVRKLEPDSKEHARHAPEHALADGKISRGEYEELIGYVLQRMFKKGD